MAGAAMTLSACASKDKRTKIVCTIFPQYDWVTNILGEKKNDFNVIYLLNSGIDLHNYQPTVKDVANISTCDLFIYVGGDSDEWVEDVLANKKNKDMEIISLFDEIEELEEGEGSGTGHEHEEDDDCDEHVWLSLLNAQYLIEVITEAICELDEDNSEIYLENAEAYKTQLNDLHERYESELPTVKKPLVIADRNAFHWLAEDYGFEIIAAFNGCAAQIDMSPAVIASLKNAVTSNGINYVLTLEKPNAETIRFANTIAGAKTPSATRKILHSAQSVSKKDIKGGLTYLKIMKDNLDVLKLALA